MIGLARCFRPADITGYFGTYRLTRIGAGSSRRQVRQRLIGTDGIITCLITLSTDATVTGGSFRL